MRIRLLIFGWLLLLTYAGIAWLSQSFVYGLHRHERPILLFLSLYASAFVLYVGALFFHGQKGEKRYALFGKGGHGQRKGILTEDGQEISPTPPLQKGETQVPLILVFTFLFRILLLLSNPIQEDDFYRYLWDGKVLSSGLNPYGITPSTIAAHEKGSDNYFQLVQSDPAFALVLSRINHPHVPTIYPPVAQIVFALSALVAPGSLFALRLFLLSFDLGICAVLLGLLRHLDRSPVWVLVYAWSPLVIKETINSAHYDVIPTFFFLMAVWSLLRNKWLIAYVHLALATLGKLYPALFLPFFIWKTKARFGWREASYGVGVGGAMLFAGYAPFLGAGCGLWQGAAVFAAEWQTNSFVFPFLLAIVQQRWLANLMVAVALGSLIVALLWSDDGVNNHSFLRKIFVVLGALFLLSPVADPWYFIWLTPFLCLFPSRAWVLLSGLLGLYYFSFYFMYHHMTEMFRWVVGLEYLPFYGLLWWEWRSGWSAHDSSSLTKSNPRIFL